MPDSNILYRDLKGLVNEDLVVEYTVRRIPRGDRQIFLMPATNEETLNSADPDESVDVLILGFDPAPATHNIAWVQNGAAIEAARNPTWTGITSTRYKLSVKVADLLGVGITPGSDVQYEIDGIRSNAVRVS